LTIGFYALAVGIAAALLGGVYAELVYSNEILIKPTILAVVAAGVILWSILPRIDRFAAPGPRLEETDQPELFGILRGISAATGEEMPAEVYLLGGEVNVCGAARRDDGRRSRRVMRLVYRCWKRHGAAVRAIIAHEFGHFHGAIAKPGPWTTRPGRRLSGP
jgi:hypothetical protein